MSYLDAIDQYLDLSRIGDIESIFERLLKIGPDAVFSLVEALSASLPTPELKGAGDFRFVGNSRLSGLPFPCSDPKCRARAFSEAAAFAAIYADEVVFFDPLSEFRIHFSDDEEFGDRDVEAIADGLYELAFGISALLTLRPLIDRGLCTFVHPPAHEYCRSCFEKGIRATRRGAGQYKKDFYFLLAEKFASAATATCTELDDQGRAIFEVEGLDEVIGHGLIVTSGTQWPASIVGKKISRAKMLRWGVTREFAHYGSNDIIFGNDTASRFGIGSILSSTPQIEAMTRFFGQDAFLRTVDTDYPLLSGARLDDVLRFRDQEWHHLHEFRGFVEDAISSGDDVDRALKDGAVQIEKLMKRNSAKLSKKLAVDAGVLMLGTAATVATAGVSTAIAAVVGALSGGHLATSTIPALVERLSEAESARDQVTYYAWKLRKRLS